MNQEQPPETDVKSKVETMLRRMGMSLSVLGAILFSEGLVVWRLRSIEIPCVSCVLILVSGITMFVSGLYIWRGARSSNQP